jgi:23S rRNA (guanosine2251-2'-O)-methyltransferase
MKKTTFLIVGKHAVLEALKNPSRKIERIFVTEDAQKKLNRENQNLNLFKKTNVFYKSRRELDNLCGRDETAHQGLVAEVEQLEEITLKEFILEIKERSSPSKTKLLYTSASGGTEHLKIFKVSNINTSLKFLKTKEFWVSAFDVSATKDFTNNDWKGKNVLLFGSEGFGLKSKTLIHSDFKFKVKMNNNIESLNISNTVSVVCHHIYQSIK